MFECRLDSNIADTNIDMKKLTIVKVGGKVIDDKDAQDAFLDQFAALQGLKILVHGGGNIASNVMKKMGIEPKMVEGRRITDAASLDVVTMVFAGLNKQITAKLQARKLQAIGLSGADLNILQSKKREHATIDYGYVGDIQKVNGLLLNQLLIFKYTPIICPLTHDNKGQLLNTNADTIASEIARGMSEFYEVDLVYCFEQLGVLSDFETKTVIPKIDDRLYSSLKNDGVINEGMIPKMDNSFDAIRNGVSSVRICHHNDLALIHSDKYPGTILC